MLDRCEEHQQRELPVLRASLLRNSYPIGAIWELACLYHSIEHFVDVEHEPKQAHPDILIRSANGSPDFAIEATVVNENNNMSAGAEAFVSQLVKQIRKSRIKFVGSESRITKIKINEAAQVPDFSSLPALFRTDIWKAFVSQISDSGEGILILDDLNIQCKFRTRDEPNDSCSCFSEDLPKSVKDYPVYKTIKRKGAQISRWQQDRKCFPIVLAIWLDKSADKVLRRGPSHPEANIKSAVYGALLDSARLDPLTRYNLLRKKLAIRHGQWRPDMSTDQVSSARCISAVLVCHRGRGSRIGNTISYDNGRAEIRAQIFINDHADIPLSDIQLEKLTTMRLSSVELGPGREAWEETHRASLRARQPSTIGGWKRTLNIHEDKVAMEIPIDNVLQVLAGIKPADSVLGPISQDQSPMCCIARAIDEGRELEACEVVRPDPLTRDTPCLKLSFGPRANPVVARTRS